VLEEDLSAPPPVLQHEVLTMLKKEGKITDAVIEKRTLYRFQIGHHLFIGVFACLDVESWTFIFLHAFPLMSCRLTLDNLS